MAWLMFYGSNAGAMLVVLMARYARSVRGDILRLVAIITAASLWPLMAVGCYHQYWTEQLQSNTKNTRQRTREASAQDCVTA